MKIKFVVATLLFLTAFPAWSQTPKLLGEHRDWDAYAFTEKKAGKTCFMTSVPVLKEPKKVKHGDIYVMVTHRPKAKIRNEVSINVGFPFQPGSEVTVGIAKKTYKMYTSVDSAWGYDAKDDAKLVKAMKAGHDMIVRGLSKRGTRVTYRFSLSGFTAAYKAIGRSCRVK